MYISKNALSRLESIADEIKRLSSLEHASFSINEKEDAFVKKHIRLWLMWYEVEANRILEIVNKVQKKNKN